MKKQTPLLSMLVVIILLACSTSDIPYLLQSTPTLPSTATLAPPAGTPSQQVLPTRTFTPTLIGLKTEIAPTFATPFTATSAPTSAASPTATVPTPAAGLAGTGFNAISLSSTVFYWGACEPTSVTLTATVTNPVQIKDLVLFIRFASKPSGGAGPWDKGTSMTLVGPGIYARTLTGPHLGVTQDSWVQFQIVGTDALDHVSARSPVYRDALSLSPCP